MLKREELFKKLVTAGSEVDQLDTLFLVEQAYSGHYADMSSSDEKSMIDRLKKKNWREVVKDDFFQNSPWLYKIITDPGRAQFLDILPIPDDGVYLDVGSGWGQITIPLARRGLGVAFDLTRNRLDILKEIAHQESVDLGFIQGNFTTFPFQDQVFDLVVFNGSLEWIGAGKEVTETIKSCQITALRKAEKILKPGGIVYIGIENSLGAKYIQGVKDDHTGIPHLTYLSEYEADKKFQLNNEKSLPSKTWSLEEYYEMFEIANLEVEKVYGCFPDYKLIRMMIDLEEVNDYFTNHLHDIEEYDGSDGGQIVLSLELKELYKTLAKNKIAHHFCPSYGFVLRKKG
ncbi:class I SAM-dependent methyltransferase [Paenibacillus sp. GCM10027626]|uniref:class I SAM-dependent methyltransferase n=1 Tax=Paenibacillus sp. GCM10027626 TaxID=3273411 RepID=UPI00363F59BF